MILDLLCEMEELWSGWQPGFALGAATSPWQQRVLVSWSYLKKYFLKPDVNKHSFQGISRTNSHGHKKIFPINYSLTDAVDVDLFFSVCAVEGALGAKLGCGFSPAPPCTRAPQTACRERFFTRNQTIKWHLSSSSGCSDLQLARHGPSVPEHLSHPGLALKKCHSVNTFTTWNLSVHLSSCFMSPSVKPKAFKLQRMPRKWSRDVWEQNARFL